MHDMEASALLPAALDQLLHVTYGRVLIVSMNETYRRGLNPFLEELRKLNFTVTCSVNAYFCIYFLFCVLHEINF